MTDCMKKKRNFNWALMLLLSMPFLFSCASYNQIMVDYYGNIKSGNYEKASGILNKSRLLKKKRNKLLYNFENGRVRFLANDYKKSNEFLNEADDLLESNFKTGKDVALSNMLNPMMETYRGEEFEKFLVHFYKALNYAALDKQEDALVEARRISLTSNRLNDKVKNNKNRYYADGFSLNFQGILYEMSGDYNNAFIAYRNAADIYLNRKNNYYGVSAPEQLKYDLINSAEKMGFTDVVSAYEAKFNKTIDNKGNSERELILFLEEGNAPVKTEISITILSSNGRVTYQFVDQFGVFHSEPFDYGSNGISASKLSDLRTIKIALPSYRIVYPRSSAITVKLNEIEYHPEIAQDLNTLSLSILQERFLSDLGKAVLRYIVKHSVEKSSDKLATSIAEKKKKSTDTDSEKEKKEENAKLVGDAVGFLVGLTNTVTEKADTRSWMSLPAYIHYVRLPLKEGNNVININFKGIEKTIQIDGKKGIQLKSLNL